MPSHWMIGLLVVDVILLALLLRSAMLANDWRAVLAFFRRISGG